METNRRKDKTDPRKLRRVLITIVLVLCALAVLVMVMQRRVRAKFAERSELDIVAVEVDVGTISTSVSGSGTLSDQDVEQLDVPEGVELKEIHVLRGDMVEKGDLLASVNLTTVLTAMNTLSKELDELDKDIVSAANETIDATIRSTVQGRVKTIYAHSNDSVLSVMGEKGALCVLSMDGTLSLELKDQKLPVGEQYTVESQGISYEATVRTSSEKGSTLILSDNGPLVGAAATVLDEEGNPLGSGELFISSPLKIVGYAGTITHVYALENALVYVGSPLFMLRDTAYTANYESLITKRQEKEEDLALLVDIYRNGGIYAPFSGTVKSIDAVEGVLEKKEDGSLPAQSFSISPDSAMTLSLGVDETDILSLSLGQKAEVKLDSIADQVFEGTVTSIDRVGTGTGGVSSYTAEITIKKAKGMLSGMSASATVAIEGVEDALIIPLIALQKTPNGYYVFTARDENGGLSGMKEVEIGISNANEVEITAGLSQGETVYYRRVFDFFSMMTHYSSGGNAEMG